MCFCCLFICLFACLCVCLLVCLLVWFIVCLIVFNYLFVLLVLFVCTHQSRSRLANQPTRQPANQPSSQSAKWPKNHSSWLQNPTKIYQLGVQNPPSWVPKSIKICLGGSLGEVLGPSWPQDGHKSQKNTKNQRL